MRSFVFAAACLLTAAAVTLESCVLPDVITKSP